MHLYQELIIVLLLTLVYGMSCTHVPRRLGYRDRAAEHIHLAGEKQ